VKVHCAAFRYLHFGFVIFWQKNIDTKAAPKMVMKLTTAECLYDAGLTLPFFHLVSKELFIYHVTQL